MSFPFILKILHERTRWPSKEEEWGGGVAQEARKKTKKINLFMFLILH